MRFLGFLLLSRPWVRPRAELLAKTVCAALTAKDAEAAKGD